MNARWIRLDAGLVARVLVLLAALRPVGAAEALEAAGEPARSATPREVRSLWVTRWDFRTEQDVRQAVRWSAAYGFDRIFLQVRGRADAFYRSALEPWGEEIGGDPGFDPLAVALEQARESGVELHAWLNVLPGWKGARTPRDPRHVFHRHPEWFLVDLAGRRLLAEEGEYTVLNPCLPDVRMYITNVVRDIASRYAVDGVHLDYVRFVRRDAARGRDFPYDPLTLALFRRHSGRSPFDAPQEWDDWRRRAVNTLVHDVTRAIRSARSGATISVAAIADYDRARDGLFQDVVSWQRFGWVDEICPMTYARDPDAFRALVANALAKGDPRRVYPGIGAYLLESPAELVDQVETCRSLAARGLCVFAYADFFPSRSHESAKTPQARALRARLRAALRGLFLEDRPEEPPAERLEDRVVSRGESRR